LIQANYGLSILRCEAAIAMANADAQMKLARMECEYGGVSNGEPFVALNKKCRYCGAPPKGLFLCGYCGFRP
jgi:hypothetical protein